MSLPLVSCIMPTHNRKDFIPFAIENFIIQDYPNLELIIIDDSDESIINLIPKSSRIKYLYSKNKQSIGIKRNLACKIARGEIIVHIDDDDWYAPDWVTHQVKYLIKSKSDICGLNQVNFHILNIDRYWNYIDNKKFWIYGATFAYWKSFWIKHLFEDMQAGEDNDFIWRSNAKIYQHQYSDGYLGTIHKNNIGIVPFEDLRNKIQVIKWMKTIKSPEVTTNDISSPSYYNFAPLVTCIMPTSNRQKFIPMAIKYFLEQDYPNKELVIIDDGKFSIEELIPNYESIRYFYYNRVIGTIGMKRNIACEKALGSIILHWDDDDWYKSNWITKQVNSLIYSSADICGLNQIQFYSVIDDKYWMTKNMNSKRPWLSGATLIYRKSFWQKYPFKNLQIGEDDDFIRNNGAKIYAHNYYQGFISIIHKQNTSIKIFE